MRGKRITLAVKPGHGPRKIKPPQPLWLKAPQSGDAVEELVCALARARFGQPHIATHGAHVDRLLGESAPRALYPSVDDVGVDLRVKLDPDRRSLHEGHWNLAGVREHPRRGRDAEGVFMPTQPWSRREQSRVSGLHRGPLDFNLWGSCHLAAERRGQRL